LLGTGPERGGGLYSGMPFFLYSAIERITGGSLTQQIIFLAIPFVFGAVVGSFLNVCIYRLPEGMSIVSPPSRCPVCKRHIPFYCNIPILSYLALRGRCGQCKSPISIQYPFVELLTGLAALALFYRYGPDVRIIIPFIFLCSLIVITFIDLRHRLILDVISLPGVVIGFGAAFFMPEPGVVDSFTGIIVGGGILMAIALGYHFITGKEGMGGGDIKFLAMIGAFLGWHGVLFTLFTASIIGAVMGIITMVLFSKNSKYALPFGPFLAVGAALYFFYGPALIEWYIRSVVQGL